MASQLFNLLDFIPEILYPEIIALSPDYGAGCQGQGRLYVYSDSDLNAGQIAAIQAILDAHDPALISTDKTEIKSDGSEVATITIDVPRNLGAAATLVAVVEGQNTNPLTITNNQATLEIDALDLIDGDTIEIGVVGFAHLPISIEVKA